MLFFLIACAETEPSDNGVHPAYADTDADYACDWDGDGHEAYSCGGDDCDDHRANTYTGAEEVWYDGYDQDCGADSDQDQDQDGADRTRDCDDLDPTVGPRVEEVWYDGFDQNCDGADDYDRDGDGDRGSAYGGNDCNEDDPSAYGDAPEVCDGIDNDCNEDVDEGCE